MTRTYRKKKNRERKYACNRYCQLCNPNLWREEMRERELPRELEDELNAYIHKNDKTCPSCGGTKFTRFEGEIVCMICLTNVVPPENFYEKR